MRGAFVGKKYKKLYSSKKVYSRGCLKERGRLLEALRYLNTKRIDMITTLVRYILNI